VPLPWSGERPPFGFSPDGARAEPWLPQPEGWAAYTAQAQDGRPGSMLTFYRTALGLRRGEPGLRGADFGWLPGHPPGVLAFTRGEGFRCVVNLSGAAVPLPLPADAEVVLASGPGFAPGAGELPDDTAVWLRAR
jgi:alpha-glucosidase